MKRGIGPVTGLAFCGLVLSACGDDECADVVCSNLIEVTVRSSSGDPVSTFEGGVEVADLRIRVECDDGAPGDGADRRVACRPGSLVLTELAADEPSLVVDLRSSAGEQFIGPIDTSYSDAGGACGPCPTGQARIDLR